MIVSFVKQNDEEKQGVQQLKVLGLNWCPEKDELSM